VQLNYVHNIYYQLVPPLFIFAINYRSDMFRPQFLAIFRELTNLWIYTAYVYVVIYVEEMDFVHLPLKLPHKLYKSIILQAPEDGQ